MAVGRCERPPNRAAVPQRPIPLIDEPAWASGPVDRPAVRGGSNQRKNGEGERRAEIYSRQREAVDSSCICKCICTCIYEYLYAAVQCHADRRVAHSAGTGAAA
uniref:Uncharacterized protein n=1 Tax=Haptolina brevifila TaxID=156173 RepID=A0A7S2IKF9_9EUKA